MTAWALALGCAAPPPAEIEVTALAYGLSPAVSEGMLLADAPEDATHPLSWQVWLVQVGDRTILVDTGFTDPDRAEGWGVEGFRPVAEALPDALGVPVSAVTDVVITHGHWDHLGGVSSFPDADVWIQAEELAWMRASVSAAVPDRFGVLWSDLAALDAHAAVHVVDGDTDLGPAVHLHRQGGHTPGVQWVEIDADPPIVLTSDIAYLSENLERNVPPGGTADPAADLAAYASLRAVPGARLVPGHEPDTVGDRSTRVLTRSRPGAPRGDGPAPSP